MNEAIVIEMAESGYRTFLVVGGLEGEGWRYAPGYDESGVAIVYAERTAPGPGYARLPDPGAAG